MSIYSDQDVIKKYDSQPNRGPLLRLAAMKPYPDRGMCTIAHRIERILIHSRDSNRATIIHQEITNAMFIDAREWCQPQTIPFQIGRGPTIDG